MLPPVFLKQNTDFSGSCTKGESRIICQSQGQLDQEEKSHPVLNKRFDHYMGGLCLAGSLVNLFRIQIYTDRIVRLMLGHQYHRLDVARLLQIDVNTPPD